MQLEWETPFTTSQNNAIKFFLSSIIMYPLVEFFIDSLVSRFAARQILRGETICPHSTRICSFGPNTVYWGSSRYRLLILLGTLVYNALALAGEFGFDSAQIDRAKSGNYVARINILQRNELRGVCSLNVSNFVPVVPAAFLSCFQHEVDTSLRSTPYPRMLLNATASEGLKWCKKARKLSYTRSYKRFKKRYFRGHCKSYLKERHAHFDLVYDGSVDVRSVLQQRRPGIPLLRVCCEAYSKRVATLSGFAVGGFSEASNRDMLKFELFGMRTKFGLLVYNVPVPRKPVPVFVSSPFATSKRSNNSRYFTSGNLTCVELRFDKRLLCLDTVQRTETSVTLNVTDWVIKKGKGKQADPSAPALYKILPSGLMMSLTLSDVNLDDATHNYRKMLALYEIMQLPGMLNMWSRRTGWFRKKTYFTQVTANNIMKVIVYRMMMDKLALLSETGEQPAFERIGSREVATMNIWAVLFYVTPLITILILAISNAVLFRRVRKLAVEANAPSVYGDVLHYRLLRTTLSKIEPLLNPQYEKRDTDNRTPQLQDDTPVIGLRPRGGVGFIYKRRAERDQTGCCDCAANKLF